MFARRLLKSSDDDVLRDCAEHSAIIENRVVTTKLIELAQFRHALFLVSSQELIFPSTSRNLTWSGNQPDDLRNLYTLILKNSWS